MAEMSIPEKLILKFTVTFHIDKIPADKRVEFERRDYRTWAKELKQDMEGDPEFGPYTTVTFDDDCTEGYTRVI